jgi:plastocyanin
VLRAAAAAAGLLLAAPVLAGAVKGSIKYEGAVPALKPIAMDADPGCAKKHTSPVANDMLVLGSGNTLGNVFVKVSKGLPADKTWPTPTQPVVLDQHGCRYQPHVMGVMVNQPIKIKNSDGLLHNVHALPEVNQAFNQAMPASVTETVKSFTKPEPMFKIKCDVHPWMGAYVEVLTHPFFAVTTPDGKFEIPNLPAGTYEITAWHEKLGTKTGQATVAADGAQTVDFVFSPPSK